MKSLSNIMVAIIVLLSSTLGFAQIKNQKTETVTISGNCSVCKATIEKAGNVKNIASVVWNEDSKKAVITYDSKATNKDEILKRIALAGYDSENFLAPTESYNKLNQCCQYERTQKPVSTQSAAHNHPEKHANNKEHSEMQISQVQSIITAYFEVKNALVQSDGVNASKKALELNGKLEAITMDNMTTEEHNVWMTIKKDLLFDASHIADTKDVGHQREHFSTLSSNIYLLAKTQKLQTPIYYQHCPMFNKNKGANWLSDTDTIKNPYYGSMMLSCGSNQETIQ